MFTTMHEELLEVEPTKQVMAMMIVIEILKKDDREESN